MRVGVLAVTAVVVFVAGGHRSGGLGLVMADVLDREVEQGADMGVVEAVDDGPPVAAAADGTGSAEKAQRVRDRRLADLAGCGEVTHAKLACEQQRMEDPRS